MVSALASVKSARTEAEEFQHTEIGQIPSDWKLQYVEDFCKISTGGRNTQDRVADGAYPFFVRSQKIENIDSYSYDEEAILTAGDGVGTGKVFHHIEGKYDAHQRVYRMFDFSDEVSAKYFFRYFSANFYARIMQMTAKSSVDSVRRDMISRMPIALPRERSEQDAIAEALSDADAFIESLEQLIAKKRAIRQCAMHQLLTPQHDWIEVRLGDSAQLKARIGWQGLTTSEYLESGDYHLVTGTEFFDGFIDWDNCHYVDKARYDQDKYIQIRNNDVLVTKDGTIGKVAFVDNLPLPATLNSGVFVIRPLANAFHPKFFYYLLMSPIFSEFLAKLSAGSTISHLYQKDFVKFSFFVPPTEQQQEDIASTLMDMDRDIRATEARLTQIRRMKQGMMQELLTGRTRLV
jgi:type I restriction enzyme S subunit